MVLVASWTNLPGIVECRPTNPSSGPFNSAADGRRFATGLRTTLWRCDLAPELPLVAECLRSQSGESDVLCNNRSVIVHPYGDKQGSWQPAYDNSSLGSLFGMMAVQARKSVACNACLSDVHLYDGKPCPAGSVLAYGISFVSGLMFSVVGLTPHADQTLYPFLAFLSEAVGCAIALRIMGTAGLFNLVALVVVHRFSELRVTPIHVRLPAPLQGFSRFTIRWFHATMTETKEAIMKTGLISMLVAGLLGGGIGVTYAADAMAEKEASPTIKERLTKDTIKGTLMSIEGEFYSIKDNDGKQYRVHVDKSTKLDKVVAGDMVKAYVTDNGHTTTLQRDN